MPFYLTSLWGKEYFGKLNQSSGAGAGRSRMRLKKNQEPEPLEKKTGAGADWEKKSGAGAGAAKKFAGSPALQRRSCIFQRIKEFWPSCLSLPKPNILHFNIIWSFFKVNYFKFGSQTRSFNLSNISQVKKIRETWIIFGLQIGCFGGYFEYFQSN